MQTTIVGSQRRPGLIDAAPAIFVLLWSTGFIGARYGLPYIEPFTFLEIRFVIATTALALIALVLRAPLPSRTGLAHSAVVGVLLHGGYLGGVFYAIDNGMPAGVSALIVSMQPVLTAVLAPMLLGERVNGRQWAGLGLGLLGVALVIGEKLSLGGAVPVITAATLTASLIALFSTTGATLYQKYHGAGIPLLWGTATQYAAAAVLMLALASSVETRTITWAPQLFFAMAWLVCVLSLGAVLLLMFIIRRTSAARTASLFYLVPPATAIEAYLIFGERFGLVALVGLIFAVAGVALVTVQGKPKIKV
ncbi:MAG: DMT family transporter [Oscillochloris sp.]|nr:DMT family transporter [Oscillochloris sp.]